MNIALVLLGDCRYLLQRRLARLRARQWPLPLPDNLAGWYLGHRLCQAGWHNVMCRGWSHCPRVPR